MNAKQYAAMAFGAGLGHAEVFPDRADETMDKWLARIAENAMLEKLESSRDKGRGGWWDEKQCSVDDLKHLLLEHVEKGDMVDVMNIAAMIYARECAD